MNYYFVVKVSEGECGFKSDDYYTSPMFKSVADCLKHIDDFEPNCRWSHLRDIKYIRIYTSGTGQFITIDK